MKKAKKKSPKLLTVHKVLIGAVFLLLLIITLQKFQIYRMDISPNSMPGISQDKQPTKPAKTEEEKEPVYIPKHAGNRLKVPILMYHYIGNNPNPTDKARNTLSVPAEKFEAQLQYLKDNGYTTTSLDTLYAAIKKITTLPDKTVILTFDDGYIDFYFNAYPILKKYGFSATVFIPTGFIGKPAYLSWAQIKEMHSSGLISFGAHTVNHVHLPSVYPEKSLSEMSESKKTLQDQLGIPINFLAYPYGSASETTITHALQAGFTGSVGTWPDKTQSEGTIYNMPRLRVSGSISLEDFAKLL